VTDQELLAKRFEDHRAYLHSVAYRMLGSTGEADDAVQEAWLRLSRSDSDAVDNLRAWLTTVVGRVSLDMLRARKARHEDPESSTHPEPIVNEVTEENPAEETELADSVGLAMMVVLETLSPAERLAFVLHDMFAIPFSEIAEISGRSPEAARQLASRARRQVRGSVPPPDPDLEVQRRVVDAFLSAARAGDFEALLELLDPDVVQRIHTEPGDPRWAPTLVGADRVARRAMARGAPFAPYGRPAIVNGNMGVVVDIDGKRVVTGAVTITNGKITTMDIFLEPIEGPQPAA
jgi:RNA polymerase sigma factor (sigma-70 family)